MELVKIMYRFADGHVEELEVEQEIAETLRELDRQEYNNTRRETRRHTSLSAVEYEDERFAARDVDVLENRTQNPMNRAGGVLDSRIRSSMARSGDGEGKAYRKYLGRHLHRQIAEQIIGRPLHVGEVVHHIDGNKLNNDPSNIAILPSQAEHARLHCLRKKGGDAK